MAAVANAAINGTGAESMAGGGHSGRVNEKQRKGRKLRAEEKQRKGRKLRAEEKQRKGRKLRAEEKHDVLKGIAAL